MARTGAINLADLDADPPAGVTVPKAVADELDSILFFGGHNGFLDGGEKALAIRGFKALIAGGVILDPDAVVAYAMQSGETDA